MKYPRVFLDAYNEYNLEMAPPKNFKNLVCKINNNFKNNFEELTREVLKNFHIGEIHNFNWKKDRGLSSIVLFGGRSCGIYFSDFEEGIIFKNVESAEKAIAFLNVISDYYKALQELDNTSKK